MKTNGAIYVIIDTVAEAIVGFPFIAKHPAAAIREFKDAIANQKSVFHAHPEDHELRCLGYISEENDLVATGFFTANGEERGPVDIRVRRDVVITGKALVAASSEGPTLVKDGTTDAR